MSGFVGTQHTNTGLLGITTFAPDQVVKSFHRKDVSSGTLAPSNGDATKLYWRIYSSLNRNSLFLYDLYWTV